MKRDVAGADTRNSFGKLAVRHGFEPLFRVVSSLLMFAFRCAAVLLPIRVSLSKYKPFVASMGNEVQQNVWECLGSKT
jgi:hypothetical protein